MFGSNPFSIEVTGAAAMPYYLLGIVGGLLVSLVLSWVWPPNIYGSGNVDATLAFFRRLIAEGILIVFTLVALVALAVRGNVPAWHVFNGYLVVRLCALVIELVVASRRSN